MSEQNTEVQAAVDAATTEQIHNQIKANFDNKVDVKEVKFGFRKVKDEKTGIESKRPTVELAIPVPSVEGIIAILEAGGKQLELLQEAVADVVLNRAREIVNEKEDITQANFPLEQLSWESIANLPKAERRGGGISKEQWESFAKDYIAVMPAVTGRDLEKIGNQAKILLAKFQPVKSNKAILKGLKEQIAIYATNSPNAEEFADCITFLSEKADVLINTDEAAALSNLF